MSHQHAPEVQPDGTILIWDPIAGRRKHGLVGQTTKVYALAFHPDGSRLALAVAPTTAPSHASMFTGLLPREHLVDNNRRFEEIGNPIVPPTVYHRRLADQYTQLRDAHRELHGNDRATTTAILQGRYGLTGDPPTFWERVVDRLVVDLAHAQPVNPGIAYS